MTKFYNYILAIALFSLRIPAIWYVIILYLLFQVFLFLPFNMVECAGINPDDVNSTAPDLPKVNNCPNAIYEIKDSSTVISEGFKTVGNSLSKLAPALAGIGAGTGAAKILKTLPPAQRAGSIVAAGAFTGGVTLASQVIAKFPNVETLSPGKFDTPGSEAPAAPSNTLNSETKQENVSSAPDFNVDSPFELEIGSLEEGLTLVIIIFTIGALYAVFTVLFNLWARSFNLESRPFVTSRPKLAKWVSYALIGHNWWSVLTLFLAWLCLLGILFTSLYLYNLY